MALYFDGARDYDAWRTAGPSDLGAECEPDAPRCEECSTEAARMGEIDGLHYCRACLVASLDGLNDTDRAVTLAAIEECAL